MNKIFDSMVNLFVNRRVVPFLLLILVTALSPAAYAQQDINVRVQVNRMPDGHYPTKIYQFNSTPGLVVLTLTNLTNTTRTVYLAGKLTGDNGVLVATPKNYQPPTNIELAPFASKTLNAIEASYLFDANNLVYISGSTSIKSSVFGESGLPEGTYQLCIRAIDAGTRRPLSDEDPIGCSNIFTVSTLEPPVILSPYNEEILFRTAVQTIPIRWTTPPGAPPSTEYLLRIVEIFGQRNPYDAIFSTSTPFFETTVRGSPLFLYSIQQPLLQEGRSYAMIVVASDPLGVGTFRNRGQSEVVQFTYGSPNGAGDGGSGQQPPAGPTVEYANHSLSGRLTWAFKKSETSKLELRTGGRDFATLKSSDLQLVGVTTPQTASNPIARTISTSPFLAATLSKPALGMQTAITPLVSMNILAAVNADPTLTQPANSKLTQAVLNMPTVQIPLPTGIVSGSGSTLSDCSYETVTVDSAAERFPLAGVPVMLYGLVSGRAVGKLLLATGQTDADGNYTLQFLDPAYTSGNGATGLLLTIGSVDFENTNMSIPLSVLGSASAQIGNHTLLAKTFRVFPKVVFDSLADNDNGYGFHIYRDVQDLQDRPWLANEGQAGAGTKSPVMVDGRQMIEIAADSVPVTSMAKTGLQSIISVLDAKGAGRIFFGGNLYVKIVPSSSSYFGRSSIVNGLNVPLPSNKILVARLQYSLTRQPAHISGNVGFPLGAQGKVPIQGAIVRVIYKKADREPGPDPNAFVSQVATLASNNHLAVNSPSWTDQPVKDPGITTLQTYAYLGELLGYSSPTMLTAKASGGFNIQAALEPLSPVKEPSAVPDDSKAITSTADDLGNYFISLPPLRKGAIVTVEVISTPPDFRNFLIEATGRQTSIASLTLEEKASAIVDFTIKGDVADVVGRVVDDQGKALANARINFKGSTLGATGPDGIFQFTIYPGTHVLSLDKEGYVVKDVTITVPQLTNNSQDNTYSNKWLQMTTVQKQSETLTRIGQSQTVQASISRGNAFAAPMFGIAAPTGPTTALFSNSLAMAFGVAAASPGSQYEVPRQFALDLKDIGYLNKIVGKARFRVVEAGSGNPIAGVKLTVFDSTNVTDAKGEWYYEGFGGTATLTLIPPAGTAYIAVQKTLTLSETGKEQLMIITLDKGIAISGIVSSGGSPLAGARILLDDQDFTGIITDASGHYTFYTTPGPHKVGARKQGYVGSDQPQASIMDNKTIDFSLTGGNGKNLSSLLGFAIELDVTLPAGPGQQQWTGNFVRISPVDKNAYGVAANLRIPFSHVVVSFDSEGNAIPAGNVVKTDLTELDFKLFGYLPVKLVGDDVVTFTRMPDGKGQLTGKVRIAFEGIQGYRGWSMNDGVNVALAHAGSTTADKILLFNSGGDQPADQSFGLVAEAAGALNGQLYGFNVGLNGGTVGQDGIDFAGNISTPASGPIKSISIVINKLALNRALSVSAVLLKQDAIPTLSIATWTATIDALIFNEDGFKIGGNLGLAIPKSSASIISFSDLAIAKSGLFGGTFNIPDGGINILSMAYINSDHNPLTFGRIGSSDVYHLTGKGNLKINISILEAPLDLPNFEIMTNGGFGLTAINKTLPIGPFQFTLTNLIVNANDNTPTIVIQGQFKADFSFLKFEVGDITIRPTGGGPAFSISKVGAKLDVPVVTAGVLLSFDNNGFSGDGALGIPGTPINGTVGFRYYKRPDGIELGAQFFVNLPPIPIGGPVTLEGIGGGFNYISGGPNGGFSVDVKGKVSLFGTGAAVALNPIGIHVSSAGILEGYSDVKVASYLSTGHAEVIFNGPDQTFTVQITEQMSPLEGLEKSTIQGALILSAKKDDEYAFLGVSTEMKLLGLINNHGEMAIAVALKNPKTRDDLTSHYFEYAPEDYMRERFSGVYMNVASHVGVSEDDALGFDFFIASAKAWFEYGYNANLLLNFAEGSYRISFGGGFSLGAEVCVAKVACVGISASMCIHVEGGRNDAQGWNFGATAAGDASLSFGLGFGDCDPGCNEFVTFWDGCIGGAFKICGNASLDLNFSERNGVSFKVRGGGDAVPCM